MKAPDAKQREAIEALQRRGLPWDVLMAWLGQNHARAQSECVRADDEVHLRRAQGEARCLAELIEMLTAKS